MEQIIRHFGRGFAAVAAALLLTGALFFGLTDEEKNQGILKLTGAAIKPGNICYTDYEDYKMLQAEAAKPEPAVVETFGTGIFYAGRDYRAADYVTAVDENGKNYAFRMEKVLDESGNETETPEQRQAGILSFERSGIYHLQIAVCNDAGKRKRYQIAVSVTRKQEGEGAG